MVWVGTSSQTKLSPFSFLHIFCTISFLWNTIVYKGLCIGIFPDWQHEKGKNKHTKDKSHVGFVQQKTTAKYVFIYSSCFPSHIHLYNICMLCTVFHLYLDDFLEPPSCHWPISPLNIPIRNKIWNHAYSTMPPVFNTKLCQGATDRDTYK